MSGRSIAYGAATLAAVAVLAALTTGAFASWTSTGSGGGAVTVASGAEPVSFSLGTATTLLYPGHSASVAVVAHNPNAFSVHLSALAVATDPGAIYTVDAGHSACEVAVLSFATQDNGGSGWTVPPKVGAIDGVLAIDMPSALFMGADAANACQGATFSVRLRTIG